METPTGRILLCEDVSCIFGEIEYKDERLCFSAMQVFAREKRKTFSLDWGQLRRDIEDEKNGIMPPPLIIKRPALPAGDKGKGGRASARTAAKGKGEHVAISASDRLASLGA